MNLRSSRKEKHLSSMAKLPLGGGLFTPLPGEG